MQFVPPAGSRHVHPDDPEGAATGGVPTHTPGAAVVLHAPASALQPVLEQVTCGEPAKPAPHVPLHVLSVRLDGAAHVLARPPMRLAFATQFVGQVTAATTGSRTRAGRQPAAAVFSL